MPATSELCLPIALADLTGPHDPYCLSAGDFANTVERTAADLPAWPLVIVLPHGPAPDCLFAQPLDAFRGPIARFPFIGQTRKASRFAKHGFAWYARPAGSTAAEVIFCLTYSEALHTAAGLV